jgi:DNA polymerase-3 subunit alpha
LEGADLNKRGLESLIKAGAFSSFGGARSQYINVYERFLTGSQNSRKYNIAGQMSLLDMDFDNVTGGGDLFFDELPNIPEFPMKKMLEDEKEVLGIYVSGHPLMDFEDYLSQRVNATSKDFMMAEGEEMTGPGGLMDNQMVTVGGIVTKKNIVYTRRENKPMCFVTIEDLQGFFEIMLFPNLYQIHGGQLVEGTAVLVEGKVNLKEEQASIVICEKIQFLEKDSEAVGQTLWLKVAKDKPVPPEDIMALLSRYGGQTPVMVYDEASGERKKVTQRYWVNCRNEDLLDRLRDLLGMDCVVLKG